MVFSGRVTQTLFAAILLLWTLAMLGLHLASRWILRRALGADQPRPAWLTARNVVRFEGLYYVALVAFWWSNRADFPLFPLVVLAAIHLGGWAFAEARRTRLAAASFGLGPAAAARLERVLLGIQIFDLAEAAILAYIGWKLVLLFT